MAKRWSDLRRKRALTMHAEGISAVEVAGALGLPEDMVVSYFAALDNPTAAKKAKPAAAAKKAPTKKAKPAAAKKAAAKAGSKKKDKAASKKKSGPRTLQQKIDEQIASAEARFGNGALRRASELESDYYLRRPTGILSLDIGLGGGWPAAALCLLTGPDGAGKDYIALRTLAEQQRIHGESFCAFLYFTEFPLVKLFARDMCGLKVAMTEKELNRLDKSRLEKGGELLTVEERERYKEQVGTIIVVPPMIADDGLDLVLDAVFSNIYQVVLINSLGVLQTAAKEGKESLREFAMQSNEAVLLTKFIPQLFMVLNGLDEDDKRNRTLVLATNQVRSRRDMPRPRPGFRVSEKSKYQSGSGAKALAHGKAIELMLHKGQEYADKETKPHQVLGREVEWELLKGKLGTHDGIKGTYDFWFDGGADTLEDLIDTAVSYEAIEQAGSWYTYQSLSGDTIRTHGHQPLRSYLREHPDDVQSLIQQSLLAAGIDCIYTEED